MSSDDAGYSQRISLNTSVVLPSLPLQHLLFAEATEHVQEAMPYVLKRRLVAVHSAARIA
jgi:hypothetical protein